MESPSAPAHRGHVPWQGLLVAVSLLTFRGLPTTAQLTVVSVSATEGEDVLLLVLNLPENLFGYIWYRGESTDSNCVIATYVIQTQKFTPGSAHSGRETIYPNGSLLFRNVTLNDTGYYTMQALKDSLQGDTATGHLRVYLELPKPSITSNNSSPEEHKDPVLLMCEPYTEDTTYLWLNNSQSLQDSARLELSTDNRTLTLLHVTRSDTGPYECETRNPVSVGHSDPFTLNVLYGPDTPSIFPSDSRYPPGANLNLSCHAASNPPAQYFWLINGRPQQPTQELFIPNITANDSGSYTCLAHNSVTGLNRTTVKTITVIVELPKPSITSNNSSPEEHKDPVLLMCEPYTEDTTYLWLNNSQSLQDSARLELSTDNRTLTLLHVTRSDTGPYECETRNPVSVGHSDPFTLNVLYGPDTPSIFPSDSRYPPGANLNLSCHAASNPPAQYFWLINGRPQQPTQELFIPNITANDSGSYTCLAHNSVTGLNRTTVKTITVIVEVPKPSITSNNSSPEEHKDPVLLMCEPYTEDTTYLWLNNSQSLQDSARLELSTDNRTLTLLHVTRSDTGPYECETRNPVSVGHSDPFTLNVLYGPDTPSIFPSDSHYPPGANLNLSCHAASNPPAQYFWLINGRPQQPTQELFIPNITANDSGSYTCLAHNSVTGLNKITLKTITVTAENDYTGYSSGTIAGIVIGVLSMVALGTSLGYFLYRRRSGRSSDPRGLKEHRPPVSTPGHGPSGASISPGPLPGTRTAVPIYEDLLHPSTDVYCRISPRANRAS